MRYPTALLTVLALAGAAAAGEVRRGGLVLAAPEGFEAAPAGEAIVLVEAGLLRAPERIVLALVGTMPRIDGARVRRLGGQAVPFAVRALGAGSGGTEYELVAARRAGARVVLLTARAQSELGEPDFAAAWSALGSVRVE